MESFDSEDYAYLLENYKRLIHDQDNEIERNRVDSLAVRNVPISHPSDEQSEAIVKYPYLRRGAGLVRYGMSVNSFKEPPDLYKKKSFKSFTNQKQSIIKFSKPEKIVRKQPIKISNAEITKNPQNIKRFPDRQFAMTASKIFDDEIIPALRHRHGESFEVPIPETFLRKDSPMKQSLPKTPIRNLVLKDDGTNLPESEEEDENVESNRQNVSRKLTYDPQITDHSKVDDRKITEKAIQSHHPNYCDIVEDIKRNGLDSEITTGLRNVQNKNVKEKVNVEVVQLADSDLRARDVMDRRVNRIFNHRKEISDESDSEQIKVNKRQIAEAMKRKGLTDNVKKHLGWNTPPRKKHPCIVKKIKVKKVKPKKKETLSIHELKDRLKQLEEEKNKFQIENYKIKKLEKNFIDKKLELDKLRKDLENKIKEERNEIEIEKEKLLEEQKKLKREKLVFEKYCQETKDLPRREEREENRALKIEIEKLKDILKTKEARTGASLAQLRNRIVILERENKELKEDLEDATKVTLKKVRFESEGRVKGKIIDAINKQLDLKVKETKTQQRPNSAREKCSVASKPLRRSKSAVELKPNLVKVRSRVLSNGAAPIGAKEPVAVASKVLLNNKAEEEAEVIDLLGDTTSYMGRESECDSGMESRPSSTEDSSLRSGLSEGCSRPAEDTYSTIMEMKRRVGLLLEKDDACFKIPEMDKRETAQELPREERPTEVTNVHCPTYTQEFTCANVCEMQASRKFLSQNVTPDCFQTKPSVSNTSGCNKDQTGIRNGALICIRHGVPITGISSARGGQNVTLDRNLVRTELGNGDVEEEEIHSGVRRLYCGQCGACETTYRSNPGYRRTTTLEGNTMEEHPDGKKVCRYKTGEIVHEYPYGVKVLVMPNGEREITKPGSKTLERPDGIVRTVYDDGRQETRYPSGRVRIKNRFGHLIMDTGGLAY